jgi:hypothetical protein
LELSLAETPKNENLLIAAWHFWSNGVNAFLFGHCSMSPTPADVYMITGIDISGSVYPWEFKGSTRQTGVKSRSGYKSYIQNHMKDAPLSEVEYRAFLNMWLCRFIFCGKANEPTLNHIAMATRLAAGNRVPLGKYLLGSVYHMLHQTPLPPVVQEIPSEPEQVPAPVQGIRHEASACTQLCYLLLTNHS